MTDQKKRLWDWMIFGILLLGFSALTLVLFDRQTLGSEELFKSDMAAYIRWMLGTETEYSFPYPIYFKLGAFFYLFDKLPQITVSPAHAMALSTMVLNSGAVLITKASLNHICLKKKEYGLWAGFFISLVTFALFFVAMIYRYGGYFPGIKFDYVGVFSPTPWHNGTYLAARPFALLAFLWGAGLLEEYEGRAFSKNWSELKDYLLFSLFMLLATMTKPSYTIVHLGAAGLVMVYRLLRSRFRNLKATLCLGCCYIPTFLHLLYQYSGVFAGGDEGEHGIGFGFMYVWGQYVTNLPLAVLLGMFFPLLVLVLHIKKLKTDQQYRFGWQIYAMGLVMAAFLYEKGFRQYHFNFSWGYMAGMFMAFFVSVRVLLEESFALIGNRVSERKKEGRLLRIVLILLQWLAFLVQLYFGIKYFHKIWLGNSYY